MKTLLLALVLLVSGGGPGHADSPPPRDSAVPRFGAIRIMVDPHGHPLAAYQFELKADPADLSLVGLEGGEHPAFSAAPYYDPKALSGNRVIVAAYSTAADLPTQRTTVATLMVRLTSVGPPRYSLQLMASASSDAQPIHADISSTGVWP